MCQFMYALGPIDFSNDLQVTKQSLGTAALPNAVEYDKHDIIYNSKPRYQSTSGEKGSGLLLSKHFSYAKEIIPFKFSSVISPTDLRCSGFMAVPA